MARRKVQQVKQPSSTIMIGDTTDQWVDAKDSARLHPPSIASASRIGNRHNGFINVTWVDGHVTSELPSKLIAGANDANSIFQRDWYYKYDKEL